MCRPRPLTRVYPRVCGGADPPVPLDAPWSGLSPRVRGSLAASAAHPGDRGSIPACAGEPLLKWSPLCPVGVYPRVCGGARLSTQSAVAVAGLSPRVRGSLR